MLEEGVNGDLFAGADADVVGECLEEFKEFYLTRYYITMSLLNFLEGFLVDSYEICYQLGSHLKGFSAMLLRLSMLHSRGN